MGGVAGLEHEVDLHLVDRHPGPLPVVLHVEHVEARVDVLATLAGVRFFAQEAIEELGEEHRAVVVLRDLEDLSYEEISEITGLPLGTVKSRMRLARERFAKEAARISPHLADVTPLPPSRLENATGGP